MWQFQVSRARHKGEVNFMKKFKLGLLPKLVIGIIVGILLGLWGVYPIMRV